VIHIHYWLILYRFTDKWRSMLARNAQFCTYCSILSLLWDVTVGNLQHGQTDGRTDGRSSHINIARQLLNCKLRYPICSDWPALRWPFGLNTTDFCHASPCLSMLNAILFYQVCPSVDPSVCTMPALCQNEWMGTSSQFYDFQVGASF